MIPTAIYTHSDRLDILHACTAKLCEQRMADYFIFLEGNEDDSDVFYHYKEDDYYADRLTDCLGQMLDKTGEKTILLLNDHNILFDNIDEQLVNTYYEQVSNGRFDFIRLCRVGEAPGLKVKYLPLYPYPVKSDWIYSDQPTIWNVYALLRTLRMPWKKKDQMIKNGRSYCHTLKMRGAFHYAGELPRTEYIYDSNVFPATHNAIRNNKWNMFEYSAELLPILKELEIDIEDRGMDDF